MLECTHAHAMWCPLCYTWKRCEVGGRESCLQMPRLMAHLQCCHLGSSMQQVPLFSTVWTADCRPLQPFHTPLHISLIPRPSASRARITDMWPLNHCQIAGRRPGIGTTPTSFTSKVDTVSNSTTRMLSSLYWYHEDSNLMPTQR